MPSTNVKALADSLEILYGDLWNFPFLEEKKTISPQVSASSDVSNSPTTSPSTSPTTWRDLRETVRVCSQCEFHLNRSRSVFGRGEFSAPVIFLGDFPSNADDRKGEIFSESEGELLNKMILAMKLRPEQMYFTNLFKCRNSRIPLVTEEIPLQCLSHLEKELGFIQGKILVAMGPWAAKITSRSDAPLNVVRGQTFSFAGKDVYCTYHPRDLLESPANKKLAWEDLQRVMKKLGVG